MSSVVAVAGGTGSLGRAIVEALVHSGKYQVLVFAREANEAKSTELGAKVLAIDYSDVDSIVSTLEQNNVDTLISTLSTTAGVDPELALIKAAELSKVTRRYVPSTWGIRYTPEVISIFPMAAGKAQYLDALSKTSLTWTSVINGFFLDYFVTPHVKSYLPPLALAIDIANKTAAIPGSGDVPVVFTYSFDVANFIPALLFQDTWEKESYIIGDKVTLNELLGIAEEARGCKFETTHDSMETLKQGKVTELPAHPPMYPFFPKEMLQGFSATFGVLFEEGFMDLNPERSLNEQFPKIKTRGVRELVGEAWRGR